MDAKVEYQFPFEKKKPKNTQATCCDIPKRNIELSIYYFWRIGPTYESTTKIMGMKIEYCVVLTDCF